MTTIATLAVKLVADAAGYMRTMDEAGKKAQTWSANVSGTLKDAGRAMTNTGGIATTFLTLPILGAGTAALTYASNLEETKNKSNVVFGSMSNDVLKWSQNSDVALGMSQQKALDAVSTFGAMGQAAGLSADQNVTWSQSLVQLASDWSSFYNLNPADSLNAIQSAVAGQYEPLRRMGVILSQTVVEQKAMQMGLMEEGETLSDAARFQTIYALMVEKSAAAQGDFERTASGVANQTRIVKAQFENAAATLGQQLLPYATQLLGWISQAISWFQALTPEQQKWIVGILAVVAVVGPLLVVLGTLISAIGAIAGVIGAISTPILVVIAVIAALIAIGYALYMAWQSNWMGIQGVVQWVITYITTIVRAWQAAFNGDWYQFGVSLLQAWDMVWQLIVAAVNLAWTNLKAAISTLVTNVITFFKNIDWANIGTNIVQGIANGIKAGASMIATAAKNVASAALNAAKGFLGIHSPSSVFEMQVGWQMAAGAALGWERGLSSLLAPTLTGLQPAPAFAGAGGMSAGSSAATGIYGGGSQDMLMDLMEELRVMLRGMPGDIAKSTTSAIEKVGGRR